jgi:hypothetical protein
MVLFLENFYLCSYIFSQAFQLCGAIVNCIAFLIILSACSLLVYEKATDFHMLVLYPATLSKVFIRFMRFLIMFIGCFKYRIISLPCKDNLVTSFPILISFISFS